MAAMTEKQLSEFIDARLAPTRDLLSKELQEVVAEAIRKALDPIKKEQSDLATRLASSSMLQAPAPQPKQREKGAAFGRVVSADVSRRMRGKPVEYVIDVLADWGDKDLADQMKAGFELRAKAMAAGDPLAGGVWVPPSISADIIDLLRPASVVRAMGPTMIPMPTGTVKIPKITSGSTATYIGENINIPISQLATGQVTLTYKKLTAMVPISNDLVRYASIGSPEGIVRNDTVRSLSTRENLAYLRGDGLSDTPKGLLSQAAAANVFATTGTWVANLANCLADLAAAQARLMNNNIPMTRCGWIMSPNHYLRLAILTTGTGQYVFRDELARGTLWGFPYRYTTHCPGAAGAAELYFADFDDVLVGDSMNMIVDSSMEASYFDGTALQSAFSLDQTLVRCISEADLGVRRAESIAVVTGGTV